MHYYLDLWSYDGTLDRIHHALYAACRELDDNLDQQDKLLLSPGHVTTRLQRLCTPALTLIASLKSP